jgi:hypothetical protein
MLLGCGLGGGGLPGDSRVRIRLGRRGERKGGGSREKTYIVVELAGTGFHEAEDVDELGWRLVMCVWVRWGRVTHALAVSPAGDGLAGSGGVVVVVGHCGCCMSDASLVFVLGWWKRTGERGGWGILKYL